MIKKTKDQKGKTKGTLSQVAFVSLVTEIFFSAINEQNCIIAQICFLYTDKIASICP